MSIAANDPVNAPSHYRGRSGLQSIEITHAYRLGPDLTQAFARLEGRKALAAWLSAPATAVMGKAFGSAALDADEVLPLVAFLKDANERGDSPDTAHGLDFLVLGVAVAAGVLVLFDVAWKSRFRAVRGPLVNGGVS